MIKQLDISYHITHICDISNNVYRFCYYLCRIIILF